MKIFRIKSEQELDQIVQLVLPKIQDGGILALQGKLGAGKTTFTQQLIKELGSDQTVTSPTFTILNIFQSDKKQNIYHFDLYRLKREDELENIGFSEMIEEKGAITIIEWPELAQSRLPENTIWINIEILNEEERKIVVKS